MVKPAPPVTRRHLSEKHIITAISIGCNEKKDKKNLKVGHFGI